MLCLYDEFLFQPLSVGSYSHTPGIYAVKGRSYAALSYRMCGKAAFRVDGMTFTSTPGDVLFIPAFMDYHAEYTQGESLAIHLTDCNYSKVENMTFHADAYLQNAFQTIYDLFQKSPNVHRVKAQIYALLADMNELSTSAHDTGFSECLAYIEKHLYDPTLSIPGIAHALCMSESTLRRSFYRHFGVAPLSYIRDKRLHSAAALLSEKSITVKEAAFAVGFTDEKYFSRCIREKYHVSPSSFRKEF